MHAGVGRDAALQGGAPSAPAAAAAAAAGPEAGASWGKLSDWQVIQWQLRAMAGGDAERGSNEEEVAAAKVMREAMFGVRDTQPPRPPQHAPKEVTAAWIRMLHPRGTLGVALRRQSRRGPGASRVVVLQSR